MDRSLIAGEVAEKLLQGSEHKVNQPDNHIHNQGVWAKVNPSAKSAAKTNKVSADILSPFIFLRVE